MLKKCILQNVSLDLKKSCGFYYLSINVFEEFIRKDKEIGYLNYDIIGMVVVDINGYVVFGIIINGFNYKILGY